MPYSITHNTEEDIIEIQLKGETTLAELEEMATNTIQLAKNTGCYHVLTDARKTEITLSITDLYHFSKTIVETAAAAGIPLPLLKRALIARTDQEELNFLETVQYNRGHHMALFHDMEEAKQWLLAER